MCYYFGEDGHFSKEFSRQQLVSQLGSTCFSCHVRALRVCYNCIKFNHQSRECLRHKIFSRSSPPNYSLVLWHIQLEAVYIVPQLVISIFSLSLEQLKFVFYWHVSHVTLDSIMKGEPFISFLYLFYLRILVFSYLSMHICLGRFILIVVCLGIEFIIICIPQQMISFSSGSVLIFSQGFSIWV